MLRTESNTPDAHAMRASKKQNLETKIRWTSRCISWIYRELRVDKKATFVP